MISNWTQAEPITEEHLTNQQAAMVKKKCQWIHHLIIHALSLTLKTFFSCNNYDTPMTLLDESWEQSAQVLEIEDRDSWQYTGTQFTLNTVLFLDLVT